MWPFTRKPDKGCSTVTVTTSIGGNGYAECLNEHGVHWWTANGEPPLICDTCGERLWAKSDSMSLTCVSYEAT
jgi:hypothetical protein